MCVSKSLLSEFDSSFFPSNFSYSTHWYTAQAGALTSIPGNQNLRVRPRLRVCSQRLRLGLGARVLALTAFTDSSTEYCHGQLENWLIVIVLLLCSSEFRSQPLRHQNSDSGIYCDETRENYCNTIFELVLMMWNIETLKILYNWNITDDIGRNIARQFYHHWLVLRHTSTAHCLGIEEILKKFIMQKISIVHCPRENNICIDHIWLATSPLGIQMCSSTSLYPCWDFLTWVDHCSWTCRLQWLNN